MDRVLPGVLLLVGVIHLMPVAGLFSVRKLATLYGVAMDDPTLMLLLQHRALLFGLLGGFLMVAAWQQAWMMPAAFAGLISMLTYILLCLKWQAAGEAIWRVFWVDVGASACLLVALVVELSLGRNAI